MCVSARLATKDAVMGSQDVVKLLAEVLGGDAQLKSLHAVVALPRQGTGMGKASQLG